MQGRGHGSKHPPPPLPSSARGSVFLWVPVFGHLPAAPCCWCLGSPGGQGGGRTFSSSFVHLYQMSQVTSTPSLTTGSRSHRHKRPSAQLPSAPQAQPRLRTSPHSLPAHLPVATHPTPPPASPVPSGCPSFPLCFRPSALPVLAKPASRTRTRNELAGSKFFLTGGGGKGGSCGCAC